MNSCGVKSTSVTAILRAPAASTVLKITDKTYFNETDKKNVFEHTENTE